MNEPRSGIYQQKVLVLAIDSNYDVITKAAFDYREAHVYPYLHERGLVIHRCQGKLARRHFVVTEAIEPNLKYLTGVGHGNHDCFTGDQLHSIFTVGQYTPEESKSKIIHLLSCQTAITLGSDMVKNGCRAFFGYDHDFTVVLNNAHVFFECDSKIDISFADGMKAEEVYREVQNLYNTHLQEYQYRVAQSLLNCLE